LARVSSTKRASRTARGTNDGTQDPFGESGNAQIGFKGVPNDPRVVGGIVGIDIDGTSARLAELHAEVPAHQPGAVLKPRRGCAAATRSSSAST
jgi:hypothetical protein